MDELAHGASLLISAVLIPVVTGIIGGFTALWVKVNKIQRDHEECLEQHGKVSAELASLRMFVQSRAFLELINNGYMAVSGAPGSFADEFSKVYITDGVRAAFQSLLPDMRRWYTTSGADKLDDEKLFMAVTRDWAKDFAYTVCPALKIAHGGCVLFAMKLLRDSQETSGKVLT